MSVFEVDVVQTTGTWEFLIDQGVWELEVVTGPRGPIYVAGDPISHTVLTDRSSADQHPMSAITGLVAALAAAGGVPDAMFLIGTNEVDGTAATMATLDWDQNATASGLAPDHYTATATFAPADLAAYLTGVVGLASDYVVNVVVPGGPHPGAYSFTPATIADPWTALGGFVATKASSDWLGASVGDGDSWLKINEKNAASIDYIGTGLLLSVVNVHSALHAVEGILDRWSFNCGMSLTANVNIAATNPTLEYGGCVAGGRVFLNAQTTPSQNGHYYVNGDLTITRLNHPDVFDPPGNGYRATLVAPADPAHGLTLMWVGDDRTHYFRGGSQTQVGAPGDPGEWIVVFDPTATGGTVTTSSITGVATARILGRTTAGTGTAEELTASQVRTLLGLVIGTDVQAHDAELAAITRLDLRAWRKNRPKLVRFFRIEDGVWRHKRVDAELERWAEKKAQYVARAAAGGRAKAAKSSASSTPQAVLGGCLKAAPQPASREVGGLIGHPTLSGQAYFIGPEEVRSAFLAKLGADWVGSYLDPCGWQDVPERALIPRNGYAAERFRRDARGLLNDLGLTLTLRAA